MGRLHHGKVVLVPPVVEIEEVDGGGDAGPGHLGEVEQGAGLDRLAVEPLGEGIEHEVPPTHEPQVVPEPSQERLEAVAVAVDRPGQDGHMAPVLPLLLGEALGQVGRFAGCLQPPALHDEGVPAHSLAIVLLKTFRV